MQNSTHSPSSRSLSLAACSEFFNEADILRTDEIYTKLQLGSIEPEDSFENYQNFFSNKLPTLKIERLKEETGNAYLMPLFNWSLAKMERIISNLPITIAWSSLALRQSLSEKQPEKRGWTLVSKGAGVSKLRNVNASPTLSVIQAAIIAYMTRHDNILKQVSVCRDSYLIDNTLCRHTLVKASEENALSGRSEKELRITVSPAVKSVTGGKKISIEYR